MSTRFRREASRAINFCHAGTFRPHWSPASLAAVLADYAQDYADMPRDYRDVLEVATRDPVYRPLLVLADQIVAALLRGIVGHA